jgi:hypothetical protein
MQQRGFISKDTGSLKLMVPVDEIDLEVPETLQQMIEAQIDRLSPEQQLVLDWRASKVPGDHASPSYPEPQSEISSRTP